MTLRIVFRRAAKSEFEDAAVRYDEQRPGLGEEFSIEIEQAVARAAAAPDALKRTGEHGVESVQKPRHVSFQ